VGNGGLYLIGVEKGCADVCLRLLGYLRFTFGGSRLRVVRAICGFWRSRSKRRLPRLRLTAGPVNLCRVPFDCPFTFSILELVPQRKLHYARAGKQTAVVAECLALIDSVRNRGHVEAVEVKDIEHFPAKT
jgi:hypothetical protein